MGVQGHRWPKGWLTRHNYIYGMGRVLFCVVNRQSAFLLLPQALCLAGFGLCWHMFCSDIFMSFVLCRGGTLLPGCIGVLSGVAIISCSMYMCWSRLLIQNACLWCVHTWRVGVGNIRVVSRNISLCLAYLPYLVILIVCFDIFEVFWCYWVAISIFWVFPHVVHLTSFCYIQCEYNPLFVLAYWFWILRRFYGIFATRVSAFLPQWFLLTWLGALVWFGAPKNIHDWLLFTLHLIFTFSFNIHDRFSIHSRKFSRPQGHWVSQEGHKEAIAEDQNTRDIWLWNV